MTSEKKGADPRECAPNTIYAAADCTRWGAAPDEWRHFADLGLTEDLLPVVSNPNAVKSEASKIGTPGKLPSWYNRDGRMVGLASWTDRTTTERDVDHWSQEPDYGICLQTRNVRAIDVDVDDFDRAADIEEAIKAHIGYPLPCRRRGNSCKFLIPFRLTGDYTKRIIRVDRAQKHAIEFLATGQQFIAVGTHPSGARYAWEGGLPAVIPTLTPEQFESLWALLAARFGDGESVTVQAGAAPDRPRTAADADDPLVAFLNDRWTVFDNDRSGRVDILCPFADGHTDGISEGSSTSYFPAGVGGFDQGHFRCLHASCTDRTDHEFKTEIGYYTDGFEVIELPPPEVLPALTRKENGAVRASRANLSAALRAPACCGTRIRYDEFTAGVVLGDEARPLRDSDYTGIALHLETRWAFDHIPRELLRELVVHTADAARFDSAIEWLRGLSWDGVPRVGCFAARYLRTDDTDYTRAVSRYLWTALAGRVLQPGVKADMVPVLIGDQGLRKSSICAALAPHDDHFAELDLKKDDDALARAIRGKLVAELPELAGIGKRELEHLKAWITRRVEKWVPKYQEAETIYARRCVFIGTTNIERPLPPDPTGQRRWLPLEVGECDPDGITHDRGQLWAEGAALFGVHGVMWEEAERLAREVNQGFIEVDEWAGPVSAWLSSGCDLEPEDKRPRIDGWLAEVSTSEVAASALHLTPDKINSGTARRISTVLQGLGYEKLKRAPGRRGVSRGTVFTRR